MDWLEKRFDKYPCLHVYHYAAYEDTALKKLAARHGTREALLDQLLRERRLVDLYKVVREAIRASTPSYSIKDIEKFYRGAREGDVQTAGASIVYYERYLETGDKALLKKIERYNEDDVESTQQLHEWLLKPASPSGCHGAATKRTRLIGIGARSSVCPRRSCRPTSTRSKPCVTRCPSRRHPPARWWPTCSSSTAGRRSRSGGTCSRAPS